MRTQNIILAIIAALLIATLVMPASGDTTTNTPPDAPDTQTVSVPPESTDEPTVTHVTTPSGDSNTPATVTPNESG